MELAKFLKQTKKLQIVYGEQTYPQARIDILWNEVKDMSDEWFEKTVTELVGTSRVPPFLVEFRTAMSIERERIHAKEKEQNARDARIFWGSSYTGQDINTIIGFIKKRVIEPDSIPEQDWNNFVGQLKYMADESKFNKAQCRVCESTGLVFKTVDDYERVYKCQCSWGQARKSNYSTYKQALNLIKN
jgi:hypothetical protein